MDNPAEQRQTPEALANNGKRKRLLISSALFFSIAGMSYGVYWWFIGQFTEFTDDAYVGGNIVQLTPQIAGTVISIRGDDTDLVQQGQPVVVLDDSDTTVALQQAEAQLGEIVRQVRQLFENTVELKATVALRQAEWVKAQDDLNRRQTLMEKGLITTEDYQHAKVAVEVAQAALNYAQRQLVSATVLVDNTDLANHPAVKQAEAKVKAAYLALQRTRIPAPVSGYIAKRGVQLGERVSPGEALMAIVPLNQVWVEANFKEAQLKDVRIGQPVTLTADFYGSSIIYHGKVVGLGVGTGSAFSLLPPQNATGNWIKVVQRVPVRIALAPDMLERYPLRIGLSMRVMVDTHDRSGPVLAELPKAEPAYVTSVFATEESSTRDLIDKIVRTNAGGNTLASGLADLKCHDVSLVDHLNPECN
jgi:membrane fusion protein (multidrug efflux system)